MVTVEETEAVARLARLELEEDEKREFAARLSDILENIKHLNRLDTEAVSFVSLTGLAGKDLREDKIRPIPVKGNLMANAPEEERGHFRVPKVID